MLPWLSLSSPPRLAPAMLPAAVNGAALLRPSAIHADEQACRALSALAARLTRAGTQLQHGSQLQGSAPQAPFLFFVSALDDERREEQPPSGLLRHLHTRHAVIPGAVYDRWQRQALYPWAARPHLGVPLDITGRRHISFMRFLSVSTSSTAHAREPAVGVCVTCSLARLTSRIAVSVLQGSAQQRFVPDAEDADAALRDYQELKARLDKIQRPSTLKTTQQVRPATHPHIRAVLRDSAAQRRTSRTQQAWPRAQEQAAVRSSRLMSWVPRDLLELQMLKEAAVS